MHKPDPWFHFAHGTVEVYSDAPHVLILTEAETCHRLLAYDDLVAALAKCRDALRIQFAASPVASPWHGVMSSVEAALAKAKRKGRD